MRSTWRSTRRGGPCGAVVLCAACAGPPSLDAPSPFCSLLGFLWFFATGALLCSVCYRMCAQRSPCNWSADLYTRHEEVCAPSPRLRLAGSLGRSPSTYLRLTLSLARPRPPWGTTDLPELPASNCSAGGSCQARRLPPLGDRETLGAPQDHEQVDVPVFHVPGSCARVPWCGPCRARRLLPPSVRVRLIFNARLSSTSSQNRYYRDHHNLPTLEEAGSLPGCPCRLLHPSAAARFHVPLPRPVSPHYCPMETQVARHSVKWFSTSPRTRSRRPSST